MPRIAGRVSAAPGCLITIMLVVVDLAAGIALAVVAVAHGPIGSICVGEDVAPHAQQGRR